MMNYKNLHKNQTGLVSFMVVMVLMFILTLIILAFARIVQREQIQTLDRQLHTQAFYAAESGANDALQALESNPSLGTGSYTDCDDFTTAAGLNPDLGSGVSYSCLLVDTSPYQLEFPGVSSGRSVVTRVSAEGGAPITSLQLSWEDATGATDLSGCPAVGSTTAQWAANCQIGMLRFELLPLNGGLTRSQMVTSRGIGFLQPRTTGYSSSLAMSAVSGDNQGRPIGGDCRGAGPGPRQCTFTLTGLNMTLGYLRMRSIYRDTPVTVRAFSGAPRVDLVGAQVELDVTGRANSVLKRVKIHARIPSGTEGRIAPEFALQTTKSQCKRFTWHPGTVALDSGIPADAHMGYCDPSI